MTAKKKEYDYLFQQLLHVTNKEMKLLFEQNNNFVGSHFADIDQIKKKYSNGKLSFFQVLHKYYLIATLGKQIYPFRHLPNIVFLIFFLNFRKKTVSRILESCSDIFEHQLNELQELVPKIDIEEQRLIWQKFLLAIVLTSFINLNIFKKRKFKKGVENSFYLGLYVGKAYVIADLVLDSDTYSEETKNEFHKHTLQSLLGEIPNIEGSNKLLKFIHHIASETKIRFPREKNEYIYKVLYLLEKAQFEDLHYNVDKDSINSIVHKAALVSLKAQLSFLLLQTDKSPDLFKTVDSSIQWSLYCQLTDDLRDIYEDKETKVQTLFTIEFDRNIFNPYLFLIYLTNKFGAKYKAKWMFSDLAQVLKDNEGKNNQKQDDRKIKMFIDKLCNGNLRA